MACQPVLQQLGVTSGPSAIDRRISVLDSESPCEIRARVSLTGETPPRSVRDAASHTCRSGLSAWWLSFVVLFIIKTCVLGGQKNGEQSCRARNSRESVFDRGGASFMCLLPPQKVSTKYVGSTLGRSRLESTQYVGAT